MRDEDLDTIKNIMIKYINPSKQKVFVFGSRATGKNLKFSDFDIGIEGERLSPKEFFEMESEFEESDFPYFVDIVYFDKLPENFKEVALQKIIPISFDTI